MSPTHLLLLFAVCGLALWWGRRVPLSGTRRWLAVGCRILAIGALCLALWGPPRRSVHAVPRHVIYLVDRSASIDQAQRAWMARRIAALESVRPPTLERALMAFGGEARLLVPFGRAPLTDPAVLRQLLDAAPIPEDYTNLEAAVLSAVGLLPSTRVVAATQGTDLGTGVVLLSDGRETIGDVAAILPSVRRLGLQLFPVPPPVFGETKTVWEELAVAPVVQQGSAIPIQLVVFNGAEQVKRGQVTVALAGVPIKRQRLAVRPGWQVVRVRVPAIQRGTVALDVHLDLPADGLSEHRRAYTDVEGPPQLLLVTQRVTALPALAAALRRREIQVAAARPEDLPVEASRLLDYDAVALFNLPKSSLSEAQVGALRSYVEEFSGGLVTVGLGGDLAFESSTPSPLDALLPVTFEPKGLQEAKRRVCMILLIDRSASMYGPRIAATKRAAVALVKQLSPEDLVGILAFDTKPYVVAEVQPAGQVSSALVEKLVKLRSSGGTDVYPALTAASQRLELTGATLKHIILLSDGNTPYHRQAYEALLNSFQLSGTTVSTIGIGSAFINTDYLEFVAKSTGGTFYHMRTLEELPQLIARDIQDSLGRLPFTEGYFRPSKHPTTDWFADTDQWPTLRGYFTTTAKPQARVDLTINGGADEEPLLARWWVGQGRVVSFTSDADVRWSPDWIRWPGFDAAWAQVVRWAMRPRLAEELFVWVDESRGTPQLVLDGSLHDPQAALVAEEQGGQIPLSLIQTGSWRWQASLDHVPSGWYHLVLKSRGPALAEPGSPTIVATRWIQVGTPPSSTELVGQPPREALLRHLAKATSGVYDVPDRAFLPPTATVTTLEPLFLWWLPFVIVMLLVEIALRGSSML